MSLDVYLREPGREVPKGSGIYIRENGANREITWEEWNERFPGKEPVIPTQLDPGAYLYERNITHNLNRMADEAGLYQALWRPEELGITKASQLLNLLSEGLALLKADPVRFQAFNPSNGWGNYEGLVDFVESYLKACQEYPDAEVSVSR